MHYDYCQFLNKGKYGLPEGEAGGDYSSDNRPKLLANHLANATSAIAVKIRGLLEKDGTALGGRIFDRGSRTGNLFRDGKFVMQVAESEIIRYIIFLIMEPENLMEVLIRDSLFPEAAERFMRARRINPPAGWQHNGICPDDQERIRAVVGLKKRMSEIKKFNYELRKLIALNMLVEAGYFIQGRGIYDWR
jgi:hypothetical protein